MGRIGLVERGIAVLLYVESGKEAREIATVTDISVRTLRRWIRAYRAVGPQGLRPRKPGPESGTNSIPKRIKNRNVRLKQKHPS